MSQNVTVSVWLPAVSKGVSNASMKVAWPHEWALPGAGDNDILVIGTSDEIELVVTQRMFFPRRTTQRVMLTARLDGTRYTAADVEKALKESFNPS